MSTSTYSRSLTASGRLSAIAALMLCVCLISAPAVEAGRVVISSLPYTFSASNHSADAVDTLVLASSKLTSATNGITLSALWNNRLHGVLLDLADDTISFGTGGGNGNVGLSIGGTNVYHPYDIEIRGGYILHNSPSGTAENNTAIIVSGHDILLKDVNATVMGRNASVLSAGNEYTYSNEIDGGTYESFVSGFTSRCQYDAVVFNLANNYTSTLTANGATYHWSIHDVSILGGPHCGILLAGRESLDNLVVAEVYNCYVRTDARNDMYPSYDGTCHSSSNPYGITFRYCGPGCKIYNNIVTSGSTYGGNRGILIEWCRGTQANPFLIYDNYIDVHEGPNVEYGNSLPLHGLRIRSDPQCMRVYGNTFICTGDDNAATASYGREVHALRLSTNSPTTDVLISNNIIKTQSLSSSGVTAFAVTFDEINYPNTYRLEHNNITSVGAIYKIGMDNEQSVGPTGAVMIGDTVAFGSPAIDPHTFYIGYLSNPWICTQNVARDIVYQGGTADDDIYMASAGSLDIRLQRTLSAVVRGSNALPVPGAAVTVKNNYGQTVLTGTTGASGTVVGPVTYYWKSRTSDSAGFNNFTLKAKKGVDSITTTFTIAATSASPSVTLPNTDGAPDTIAPDPIIDLGAATGGHVGEIELAWSATGEDGSEGIADAYEIRYRTSLITDANWSSSSLFGDPPTPAIAGTVQTSTLTGLTPATRYYVAIKAIDGSDNPSTLSNVPSAVAMFSIVTDDDDTTVELASPVNDSTVNTTRPTLVVTNIDEQSDNQYYFEIATDPSFGSLAAASDAVPQEVGATTSWQVSTRLSPGQYHWRARANSNPYSVVNSFIVQPLIHAFPNPFVPDDHGAVSFTEVTPGVNLVIITISGDIVRRWVNASGDDILWDGTNASGNPVSSGTYLWFVEDTDIKGKLIVIR
jgi:hypothetical protein